jgi:hypothetical protein
MHLSKGNFFFNSKKKFSYGVFMNLDSDLEQEHFIETKIFNIFLAYSFSELTHKKVSEMISA